MATDFSRLRQELNINIYELAVGLYLEVKKSLPSKVDEYDESDHFKSIIIHYEILKKMFEKIKYDDKWDNIYNAILCSVEAFLDYVDEFIYLYENKRFTLLSHCLRGGLESFLAFNTLLVHPQGLDILKNNSDKQYKNTQVEGAKYYHIGTKEEAENEYKKKVIKRNTQVTMKIVDQTLLFLGNKDYDSHDLYIMYRFLSEESHYNIKNEMKKRLAEIGSSIKIKTQSKSGTGLTFTLHMDILVNNFLALIFRHIFLFDLDDGHYIK